MKKVLITGANGMIGNAIINELIDSYELVLVDPFIDKIEKYSNRALIIKDNLYDISKWEVNLNEVYCVIHLAAAVHWKTKNKKEEKQYMEINAECTRKLYNACTEHGVGKFLFFSTNDVYVSSNEIITEDTPVNAKGIYGRSKLLAEQYLIESSKTSNTSICIFRPASVYGVYDKGSMRSLIGLCKKGIVPIIGDGTNKKALLYVKDIVLAVKKYVNCEIDLNGEIFNISSGNFEYKDIIDAICYVFNVKPLRLYIPRWITNKVLKFGPFVKLSIAGESKIVSDDKIKKTLGYEMKYSLYDGLNDAKEFYM